MNAAIAKARETLPVFWQHVMAGGPSESEHSLKLALSDGATIEHFWCGDLQGNSLAATCAIANEPEYVHTVRFGQRVEVDPSVISDWMYRRDGKIVGAETLRVIIPRLPKDEAEALSAMLATE
jgi:uncharacterized protein YegJ (DUF2314 family)